MFKSCRKTSNFRFQIVNNLFFEPDQGVIFSIQKPYSVTHSMFMFKEQLGLRLDGDVLEEVASGSTAIADPQEREIEQNAAQTRNTNKNHA